MSARASSPIGAANIRRSGGDDQGKCRIATVSVADASDATQIRDSGQVSITAKSILDVHPVKTDHSKLMQDASSESETGRGNASTCCSACPAPKSNGQALKCSRNRVEFLCLHSA